MSTAGIEGNGPLHPRKMTFSLRICGDKVPFSIASLLPRPRQRPCALPPIPVGGNFPGFQLESCGPKPSLCPGALHCRSPKAAMATQKLD